MLLHVLYLVFDVLVTAALLFPCAQETGVHKRDFWKV